jgi:hypothetical protein
MTESVLGFLISLSVLPPKIVYKDSLFNTLL